MDTVKADRTLLSDEAWEAVAEALRLSARELDIVQALFDDQHEAEIAEQLGISSHTVHTHLERLRRKLDVHSRGGVIVRVFAEHFAQADAATESVA